MRTLVFFILFFLSTLTIIAQGGHSSLDQKERKEQIASAMSDIDSNLKRLKNSSEIKMLSDMDSIFKNEKVKDDISWSGFLSLSEFYLERSMKLLVSIRSKMDTIQVKDKVHLIEALESSIKKLRNQIRSVKVGTIDPRYYLSVEEDGERIWSKNFEEYPKPKYPNQYLVDDVSKSDQRLVETKTYSILDVNSKIEIKFDQMALAKNLDFYGNISLRAKLNDRKIEVDNYSVIGESLNSYGVQGRPVKEISENFLKLLVQARTTYYGYKLISDSLAGYSIPKEDIQSHLHERMKVLREELKLSMADSNKLLSDKIDHLTDKASSQLQFILRFSSQPELYVLYQRLKTKSDSTFIKTFGYTYGHIDTLLAKITERGSSEIELRHVTETLLRDTNRELESNYANFINSANRCMDYLTYFKQSGKAAVKAFLDFSTITQIDFDAVFDSMTQDLDFLDQYPNWLDIEAATPIQIQEVLSHSRSISINMKELSTASGELYFLLKKYGYGNEFIQTKTIDKLNDSLKKVKNEKGKIRDSAISKSLTDGESSFLYNELVFLEVRDFLAHEAGTEIFRGLIDATIDLGSADAKDGDILYIDVIWDTDHKSSLEGTTTIDSSEEWYGVSFLVKKRGWKLEVPESAFLIHRIDEDLAAPADVSPSNFKPTAGVSLLFTRYRDDRKNGLVANIVNFLEPSLGLNVSYLDFSQQRNFEVGAGLTLGLFENQIFLTTGYNFMTQGESPFYFGVGFSFSNIFSKIKSDDAQK